MFQRSNAVPSHVPAPDRDRELALYKYDMCGFCQRVLRTIDRLGLEVEMRDTLMERQHRADLFEATGRTTVPCLFIDGQPLHESSDITAWLEAYAARSAA